MKQFSSAKLLKSLMLFIELKSFCELMCVTHRMYHLSYSLQLHLAEHKTIPRITSTEPTIIRGHTARCVQCFFLCLFSPVLVFSGLLFCSCLFLCHWISFVLFLYDRSIAPFCWTLSSSL